MYENISAEYAVLSCLLLDPSLIWSCDLFDYHFLDERNRKLYNTMIQLNKSWSIVDITTILDICDITNDHVYTIAWYVFTTAWYADYVDIVLKDYNKNNLLKKIKKLEIMCEHKDSQLIDIISEVSDLLKIDEIAKGKNIFPWIIETFDKLESPDDSVYISKTTWYDTFDCLRWGIRAGSLVVIGARPSEGKSTLWINLIMSFLRLGLKCTIVSTETPAHEIHTRMMCMLSQQPLSVVENWTPEQKEKIANHIITFKRVNDCAIYDDIKYFEEVERSIIKEVAGWAKIIMIDYIQQMYMKKTLWNRNLDIWYMTTTLKHIAMKYWVWILCLAQLNRTMKPWEVPTLTRLRDSWSIEQDADAVAFLHGYDMYAEEIDIISAKNRHWPKRTITIGYKKEIFTMSDKPDSR
jgi:replicative DNA helicase